MRLFGLTGYPLEHTFSPRFFEEKFQREGITDAVYNIFPLKDISCFFGLLNQHPALCGLNVTIPYKQSVISFLDELDGHAKLVNAVNTIKIIPAENHNQGKNTSSAIPRKLIGYNTDIFGFEQSLKNEIKRFHTKALILGTGGAAKSVEFVLKKSGIDYLSVSRKLHTSEKTILYEDITKEIMEQYTLIVNTTPLGMFPETNSCPPLPYHFLTKEHFLYDLIYNPVETMFLQLGKQRGAGTANGLKMLHFQAEKSWEIWNS